ncbi:hypothetical protein GT723_21765 [Blautia wexlerae]|nr:hypothetical protein [Blautia wexlerae]
MKMCNLKTWFSGMILGLSLLAAVPVSADITNSGSTPPDKKYLLGILSLDFSRLFLCS